MIQTPMRSYSWMTTIQLDTHRECQRSVRSIFCCCPCWWIRGSAIITLPMWMLLFTDMGGDKTCAAHAPLTLTMWKQVIKTFKSAFMLLLPRKSNTNGLFNHTSLFLCYRHLNNRSTGIKVYSLGINIYCLQQRSNRKYLNISIVTLIIFCQEVETTYLKNVFDIESFIQEISTVKQVFMKWDTDSFIDLF